MGNGVGVAEGRAAPEIGRRLLACRLGKGLTQRSLADTIGVSTTQWSKFENGINRISADQLAAVCAMLEISADVVLGLQPAPGTVTAADPDMDQQARRLMAIFRALPARERRELLRAARTLNEDAAPIEDATPIAA